MAIEITPLVVTDVPLISLSCVSIGALPVPSFTPIDVIKGVGTETEPVAVVIIGMFIQLTSLEARVAWTEMVCCA